MLNQHLRAFASCVVLALAIVPHLHAQDVTPSSTIRRALKSTALDPTTYAASALYYDASIRDWNASQPFFRHGFVEQNSRFTISGFSFDTPVSYAAGRNQILRDTMAVFTVSALHNVSARLIEHALKDRYPEHRKAIAVIGWIERIGLSSGVSYYVAAPHYRQWKRSEELAARMGID